ncbi:hypothetical protein RHSIM_Rhsim03G0101000 [Rhododendron simsii]|uniref:DUF4283 domain-containing protein n=1 Tax=Rhododendron simsii TaxID=118357 RepID=A0A834H5U7_RHOSS|nr:hypothetical protein RHSIM_Rhsim03G0101000 [Rhododendron simsii]
MTVKSIVSKIWEKFGITDVLSNDDGFYFFLFNKDDAYKRILDSGPWHIGGRLMILKKWEPQMSLVKDQLVKIPIWVQFFNVPLEFWTAAGLSYVASAIGRPLYADSRTERCQRLSYARVCVEIEVGAHLPLSFTLRFDNGKEVDIKVKYPWKPLQCMDCMVFGHSEGGCKKNVHDPVPAPTHPVWVAKSKKGKESIVAVSSTSVGFSQSVGAQKANGVGGSPSNRFAALAGIVQESDEDLGFVEPIGVVAVSLGAELHQSQGVQTDSVFSTNNLVLVDELGKFSDPGCCNYKSFKDDLAKVIKPPDKEHQVLDVAFSSKGAFVVSDSPEQEQSMLDPMANMSESNSTIVVLGCMDPTGLDS